MPDDRTRVNCKHENAALASQLRRLMLAFLALLLATLDADLDPKRNRQRSTVANYSPRR